MENDKKGMSRLMELAMMKKGVMIAAIIMSVLSTVASFIPYVAIYLVIKEIILVYPEIGNLNAGKMSLYAVSAVAGVLINLIFYTLSVAFAHIAAYGTLYQLKIDFVDHITRLPLGFFYNTGSGKLREIMDNNIESIEGFIAHDLTNMVSAMTAPFLMLVVIFVVDWRFGIASFIGIILAFVGYGMTSGGDTVKKLMDNYQVALEDMGNAATEYIRGISVVKAFKQTAFSFNRLNDSIKRYMATVIPYSLSQENMTAMLTTMFASMYLVLIPVGVFIGSRTSDYRGYVATFIFYLIFVPAIGNILMKIIYAMANASNIAGSVDHMDNILREKVIPENGKNLVPSGHDIEFENVSFSYDGEVKALDTVSFKAAEGKTTAIVGSSGGGKSTIASLIPRFYDVNEGAVKIGGVDIRDMEIKELMNEVSFVFQDNFLFGVSILENIRMGRKDASIDEVKAAAKAARCDEFIEKLPSGYDTIYGSAGVNLSGGQIQRIAIARAIVKNSPVLILDEATSFSDAENEYLIQKALSELMKNKTVIMIAHRLSTIKDADNIIVMEEGKIAEQGKFEDLLNAKGRFEELWKNYTTANVWKLKGRG
ncbi:MAG: ABC transporter ATP-binding protein/permease [Butyrivibrio sp.]|nr:ABC transporter ATP-binding protein/permease [Butyrivibrio sp.]